MSQNICDIPDCGEYCEMLFKHPWKELMVCYDCYIRALDAYNDVAHDEFEAEYKNLKRKVSGLYI